jgi:excisionase family DNA binding protein
MRSKFGTPQKSIPRWAALETSAAKETSAKSSANVASSFMSVRRVAEILGVSEKTVRRLVGRQALNAVRVGRLVRISNRELEQFISTAARPPWGGSGH